MNDSLDLRNRILKMRESNNLTVNNKDTVNNNLMLQFESSIKDDNQKKSKYDQEIVTSKNKETASKSVKNNSEDLAHHEVKLENKNLKRTVNDNDAQFLMLANKFNEAVEVILELSHKVEKLERNAYQNSHKQINNLNRSSFFNFKIFIFLLIIPIIVLGYYTLPLDYSLIKSIIIDILSTM